MNPSSVAIGAIAGFVGASLALALLRRSPSKAPSGPAPDIEQLRAEFSKWDRGSGAAWFAAVLVATLPISLCLRAIDAWFERGLPHAAFVLVPARLFWTLPALFIAGGVAGGVVGTIRQRMLRERFEGYVAYCKAVYRFDYRRVARVLYPAIVAGATIMAILGVDWYVYFTDSAIVVNEFWSLGTERQHSYADIVSIETAPEIVAPIGNHVRRREYVFRFKDGSSWSTNGDPSGASATTKLKVVEFVSSRSAKPVTELPLLRP